MNTGTGEIVGMDYVEDLKAQANPVARFYKEIPEKYLGELQGMNRTERRKWYKKNKYRFK